MAEQEQIVGAAMGLTKSQGGLNMPDMKKILKKLGIPVPTSDTRSELEQRLSQHLAPAAPVTATLVLQPMEHVFPQLADAEYYLETDRHRRTVYLDRKFLEVISTLMHTYNRLYGEVEIGGAIDLKLDGGIDRILHAMGGTHGIDLSDMTDLEIVWHTHPVMTKRRFNIPSPSDIMIAVNRTQRAPRAKAGAAAQLELVFTLDAVYAIYIFPPAFGGSKITPGAILRIYNKYINDEGAFQNPRILKVFDDLTAMGVYVIRYSVTPTRAPSPLALSNWPNKVPLFVDPKEPATIALGRIAERAVNQ